MEKMLFKSPKRHRIIAIRDLLEEYEIPVTSIKLHIQVEWGHWTLGELRTGGKRLIETREKRNDLNVPIDEFTDKLNDSQAFELYVAEEHEEEAIQLIDECDEEKFFGDCFLKTVNYDEAFEIYLMLNKNNIPCDDVYPGSDAYLLFIDPEHIDKAIDLMTKKVAGIL